MTLRRTGFKKKQTVPLKRSGFKKKTALKRSTINSKAKKPKKGAKTARAKKQKRKKQLCEQYDLPIIPCSRWGTGKNPTRTELLRGMAWTVFSKHVRERDIDKPCITCGLPLALGDIQAGHYVPVGNSSIILHFMEENVNGEHPACNADFHGWHLVPMRKNMVKRYGEELVDTLDKLAGKKDTAKYEERWFVDLIKKYL